jgi:hypothetical protein
MRLKSQPAEHALDGVAVSVKERREAVRPFAVGLGRDVRHRADILDLPADGVAVVTFVAMQDVTGRHLRQKLCAGGAIGDIAACEHEGDGSALSVRQRMDFGRASAARSTDRLGALPPLPPLAERCTLTAEESMSSCGGGPPACASAWKRLTHTPLAAHRT